MSKTFTITAMGIEWVIYLQTPSTYKRMHGSDSEGITYPGDREIYFNKDYFTPAVVRHELMHCYHGSSPTSSSALKADQKEEESCEIFGEYGPLMIMQADQIVSFFARKHSLK
jgi:hypothetical protein